MPEKEIESGGERDDGFMITEEARLVKWLEESHDCTF